MAATDSGLGRINEDDGRQGDTLFCGLGRGGLDLVGDYCVANACAPSFFLKFLKKLASDGAEQTDTPYYCITFSYWQRRVSTTLQKLNARVLYLALRKIDRDQHHGSGYFDYSRVINEKQNFHCGVKAVQFNFS